MASTTAAAGEGGDDTVINSRAYQVEMLEESLKGNVIVAMPTGSGKTHVAVLRIKKELELITAGKVIWFLTPTVQLCLQQLAVLQSQITSVQMKSLTSLDNVDKWSDEATWDAVLTNVSIIVSTYAVLGDALCHAFVKMESLALIVFDEAHNCIGKSPGSKLMKDYYWPRREVGESVPHVLGLTASPVMGSNLDDVTALKALLDAKCKTPRKQKLDLASHVRLPTLVKISFDGEYDIGRRTPTMSQLKAAYSNLNIYDDPEILRLKTTNTEATRRALKKALMAMDTFIQRQMRSFIRTSTEVHRFLGAWAADAYIYQVTSSFIQLTDSRDTNSLGWEDSEKQYLANALRCLSSTSDATTLLSDASVSKKAHVLLQFLNSCDKETIGIVFVKERSMAYMLYRLLSEHPDTCEIFRLGLVVGMSNRPVGKRDIFEFSRHDVHNETLGEFRAGNVNLLIATNVVEEGIDVPRCNLVICFNEPDNLKSFIQRRGRARLGESKLVILTEKNSKSRIAEWKELEDEMKLRYEAEEPNIKALEKLEKDELTQGERRKFEVKSTGATLDMDAAKGHLDFFCSRLSSFSEVHMKPEYIILDGDQGDQEDQEDQGDEQGETLLFKAKVILPISLDSSLRVHESRDLWKSEKDATKDAAFEAYVALYHAGLINDHLVPLVFTEHSRFMEKGDSLIEAQQQFNPWIGVSLAWENKEKLQRRGLKVVDEAGLTKCQMEMLIPAKIPNLRPIHIYYAYSFNWKIEFGPTKQTQNSMSSADDTTALLSLSYGHRWEVEQLRHVAIFNTVDVDRDSLLKEDVPSTLMDSEDEPIGLLRDVENHGHPYLFHKWLSAKPPLEMIQKPHKDYESFSEDQTFVAVKKWSQRSDFLHPVALDPATAERSSAAYYTVFPRSLLSADNIRIAISQFGLLIPSILHTIEVELLVEELCSTVLSEIERPNLELIRTAISAPMAREQNNYQKLEFLGDSVLKFLTSIYLASKYPHWPEGYLSQKKDTIVSNSRLCKAALDRDVDKFIITKVFTGSKWRPIYVEPLLKDQEKTVREMSTKTIADLVESLIGAGWKMGNHATSLLIAKTFLPELDLPSVEVGRSRLFEKAADMPLPADLIHLEKLAGYCFKKKSLLVEAMSHRSYSIATTASYDRLEFLGDTILEVIIVARLSQYEDQLTHSLMHLYKTALVNGDFLGFFALEWKITQMETRVKECPESGDLTIEHSPFSLPLWRFMRHGLLGIGNTQSQVERRHSLLRCDIIHALDYGAEYPWSLLAQINANKFYSDLVESLLGAIWVDSGSLDVCEQVLERMGILKVMNRLVSGQIHALHPREELGILAAGKEVKYEVQPEKSSEKFACVIYIGEEQIIEVTDGISAEEVRTRAAEGAVALLRSANGRSGLPVAYGGR